MAPNSLYCADVPLVSYSLTHADFALHHLIFRKKLPVSFHQFYKKNNSPGDVTFSSSSSTFSLPLSPSITHSYFSSGSKLTFPTKLFHHDLPAPTALLHRTLFVHRSYPAQRFL